MKNNNISANSYLRSGKVKFKLKNYEDAIEEYTKALSINPEYIEALYERGLAKIEILDFLGAIEDYSKILEINPQFYYAFGFIGDAKSNLGEFTNAIEDYKKGLAINPKYYHALSRIGYLKGELKDFKGAIDYYSKAINIDNTKPVIFFNRGLAKRRLCDFEGAIDDFDKAINLDQTKLDAFYLRALSHIDLGNIDLAINDLEIVSRTNSNFEDVSERLKNLKENNVLKKNVKNINNSSKNLIGQKNNNDLEKLLKTLNSFIGLKDVKKEIESLINFQQIQLERDKYGFRNEPINNHMVFYGPPGTGKTEIARLVGKIFKCLGILSKGHFIEADRSSLIGGYIGQTAIKTNDILNTALGGILFIDEAYSLNSPSVNGDFGAECIATILKFMEDHRDDFVLIVAGYEKEMTEFLKVNAGLKSRFNSQLYFPNFTEKELLEILLKISQDKGYVIQDSSKNLLKNNLAKISEFKKPTFGNARSMRNLLEIAIKNQAERLMKQKVRTKEELLKLIFEDFKITSDQLEDI